MGIVGWAAIVAAAISIPYLLFEPASTDLAAQTFRADLWGEHGWVIWNSAWYSGHEVPGYSLIYPPLGSLLGPQLVAVLSAAASGAAFASLVNALRPGRAAVLSSLWLAVGAGALVYTGRITFLLGLAFGLLALRAHARPPLSVPLAIATSIASPVAGLFAAIAAAAMILGGRVREGLAIAVGASVATLTLVFAFPVGGTQPFLLSSFWWATLACAVGVALVPREMRMVRIGIAIYVVLLVALYFISTPIGSNVTRLGALLLGPIAVLTLLESRPRFLALAVLPLLYWQMASPVSDVVRATGSPSTEEAFYEPLLEQLDGRAGGAPVRVEVPATRERWESVYVAERHALARGWLRQLESDDIPDFTDGRLTPRIYEDWLRRHGVSFVALPDDTLDYISEDERDLLVAGGPSYLREVEVGGDWRLWEVLPGDGERIHPRGGACKRRGEGHVAGAQRLCGRDLRSGRLPAANALLAVLRGRLGRSVPRARGRRDHPAHRPGGRPRRRDRGGRTFEPGRAHGSGRVVLWVGWRRA